MISDTIIERNKQEITNLLRSTGREGIERVITYLNESGFFYVPSSVNRHHNWKGGLAQHSLGVYRQAIKINTNLPKESVIISALLHDLCKAHALYFDAKGHIRRRQTHIKGHGSRSVKLLQILNFHLTEDEYLAIRWHMRSRHHSQGETEGSIKARTLPLWLAVHTADKRDAGRGTPIYRMCC